MQEINDSAQRPDTDSAEYLPVEQHEAQEPEELLGDGTWLKRIIVVLAVLVAFGLMVVLPPLVNVNRYQRRISTSISASLGRPVHLDSVELNVLPMPGFTLHNFVVSEDPAFGSEPVIRANLVRATLRISSLWRRRVEFSKISLTEPSVNLVRLPDGRWNLESILLQASRMPAAPTAQKGSGETQRFPYIEATDARVNLKIGDEKVPFALTDAEFALWLPEPEQWQLRLEAKPARTDTSVSDTGTLRVEGTLGRATNRAAVPVNLTAEWSAVPLGSVSLIATGRDAGMRGEMTLTTEARGTVGEFAASSHLKLTGLRRAEFVPSRPVDVNLTCTSRSLDIMHSLADLRCLWPTSENTAEKPAGLVFSGALPDTHRWQSIHGEFQVKAVPASALLDGLRAASPRIPRDMTLGGAVDGSLTRPPDGPMTGAIQVKDASLALANTALIQSDLAATVAGDRAATDPVAVNLGGREPASIVAIVDSLGVELGVRGMASTNLLKAFGAGPDALPVKGGDKPAPANTLVTVDEHIRHAWGTNGAWAPVQAVKAKPKSHRRER